MGEKETFHPGAAKFGSFINYYQFNEPGERLKHLSVEFVSHFKENDVLLCLDVGCNSGELTASLHKCLQSALGGRACKFYALDMDQTLIERSLEVNKHPESITYEAADITSNACEKLIQQYLEKQNQQTFDCIFCFSTSMWIHINHGDDAFEQFLKKLSSWTSKFLFIEPQPWKCYKSASRRMRRLRQDDFKLSKLKIRDIDKHIISFMESSCNMKLVDSFGPTAWGRKIFQFQKVDFHSSC